MTTAGILLIVLGTCPIALTYEGSLIYRRWNISFTHRQPSEAYRSKIHGWGDQLRRLSLLLVAPSAVSVILGVLLLTV